MSTVSSPEPSEPRPARPGLEELFADTAYVLRVEDEGTVCYGIFDADGTPLAVAPTRALALAVIRRNGLEPADAH
ncbi:MAG: DUF1150 family protein [Geminicoccaceae bacterium]